MTHNDAENLDQQKKKPSPDQTAPAEAVPAEGSEGQSAVSQPAVPPAEAAAPQPAAPAQESPPPGEPAPMDRAGPTGPSDQEWIERTDRLAVGEREGDYSALDQGHVEETTEGQAPPEEQISKLAPLPELAPAPTLTPLGEQAEAGPGDQPSTGEAPAEAVPPGHEPGATGDQPAEGQYGYGEGGYDYSRGQTEGGYTAEGQYGSPSGEGGYAQGQGESPEAPYGYQGGAEGQGASEPSAGGGEPSALAAQPPGNITPTGDEEEDDDDKEGGPKMTLGEHLEELRTRIIRALLGLAGAMILTIIAAKWMIADFLCYPYNQAMKELGKPPLPPVIMEPTAGFSIFFDVALIAGMVVAAPWIFYQIWMFVAAGLYKHERAYVQKTIPFSAALFIVGAMFYLFAAAKPMIKFLVSFNDWMGMTTTITLKSHISLMATMMLVFGLAFQLPLVVLILNKIGILSLTTLRHYRRHVIVIILIVAAILTPPDPTSQIALALPLYMLYEFGIVLASLSQKKRKKKEEAEAAAEAAAAGGAAPSTGESAESTDTASSDEKKD